MIFNGVIQVAGGGGGGTKGAYGQTSAISGITMSVSGLGFSPSVVHTCAVPGTGASGSVGNPLQFAYFADSDVVNALCIAGRSPVSLDETQIDIQPNDDGFSISFIGSYAQSGFGFSGSYAWAAFE